MTNLRPYQVEVIDQFDACVASDIRNIIIVAPTGSGKTVIASEIVRRAVADGKPGAVPRASTRDRHADSGEAQGP